MKKTVIFSTFLFLLFPVSLAQIINKKPLSERITGYEMEVSLNTDTKTVSGTMKAYWVNKSYDIVPVIRMHLYMNAFRSKQTTYFTEFGGSPGLSDFDPGWTEIISFTDKNDTDLLQNMRFISPDDGNREDKTVIEVRLPEPALPGDTVVVHIDFETRLSDFLRRTGYNKDFYFVAQWFPKFGVYEPAGMRNRIEGGWNCHQFHFFSEFYSDHSLYEVTINVPEEYIVGTCGLLVSENSAAGGRKTLGYRAEDIVDFAWTAWPGYQKLTNQWKNVTITLLMPEERTRQSERQFTAVKNALEYFNENVGPYPWPYLTIVDPPLSGAGAGGMEYTTLFTSEPSFLMPEWIHLPEITIIHEFGHAYFMGILASNEFEEPWLDEGINSFWEIRIADNYYGKTSGYIDNPFFKVSDLAMARNGYITSPQRQVSDNTPFSWNYPHNSYSMLSYFKTAIWLNTLMGIIGEETMNDVFKEYYNRWAYRHPSGKDFVDVANDVVHREHGDLFGKDLNWFFEQTLYGTGICDYRVAGIENREHSRPEGKIVNRDSTYSGSDGLGSFYASVARLERIGEVMLPVEVLIHFAGGKEVLEKWDGKGRYKDFTYTGPYEIIWVNIDPEFRISMDVNYLNNSMTVQPDMAPLTRIIIKLMSFIQLFLSTAFL